MKSGKIDFLDYLKTSSGEITNELTTYLSLWKEEQGKSTQELQDLLHHFSSSIFGGKMLRGTLVKLGYELVNDHSSKKILQSAAAYEVIHTALITHDDIIDQSQTRRGKTALHLMNEDKHYGLSQAICLGDMGIILANRMISESNFPENVKIKALTNFLQVISDTLVGEMLDVHASHEGNRTEEQVLQIHEKKTAMYTIIGPLSLGAILGGADEPFLKNIYEFGKPLGVAFQLYDDILGIFAKENTVGKSITSDIEENKSTLLIVYAQQHATAQQQNILKNYYGKKNITVSQQRQIKKVFEETGAYLYSKEKIQSFIAQAKTRIPAITKDEKKQLLLSHLSEVIIDRKK